MILTRAEGLALQSSMNHFNGFGEGRRWHFRAESIFKLLYVVHSNLERSVSLQSQIQTNLL